VRLPFLQVTSETWEHSAQLAGLLEVDDAVAFKLLCDCWRWGLGLGPEDQPPEGLCDSPRASRLLAAACKWPLARADELVEALEDIGAVEVLAGLCLRVRGMDRYHPTWKKNRREGHGKDAPAPVPALPPESPRAGPARDPGGETAGPERQTQTQTQTQREDLKPSVAGATGAPVKLELVPSTPKKSRKAPAVTDPRHAPMRQRLVAAFSALGLGPYAFEDGRDALAVTGLLAKGSDDEIERRWRRALVSAYPTVKAVHELARHWNHFATEAPTGAGRAAAFDPNQGIISSRGGVGLPLEELA
jgi:hypothetical protein